MAPQRWQGLQEREQAPCPVHWRKALPGAVLRGGGGGGCPSVMVSRGHLDRAHPTDRSCGKTWKAKAWAIR